MTHLPKMNLGLVIALTACTSVDSEGIDTQQFYASYQIAIAEDEVVAMADYRMGSKSNTYIELVKGERISCNGVVLEPQPSVVGEVVYAGTLEAARSFRFLLERGSESIPTGLDAVEVPQVQAPENGAHVPVSDATTVSWTPGDGTATVTVAIAGACLQDQVFTADDEGGALVIDADTLTLSAGSGCDATLEVRRKVSVALDAPFAGGTGAVTAIARRNLRIEP